MGSRGDEVNRKILDIKGREITSLLNKFQHNATMDWQFTLNDEIQKINPINVGYSENMFGFITYGISLDTNMIWLFTDGSSSKTFKSIGSWICYF